MQIIGKTFSAGAISYEVTRELGRGGFGTVYLAETAHVAGLPPLAVKVPRPGILEDKELRRRFEREARILGNISHPNVVKTRGILSYNDGAILLVQEYIEDATELFSWRYADDAELLSVALQVLYGLRVTHGTSRDARAIHRDLSPRNVLIARDGTAKIIDFGLAREDPRTTTILTAIGDTFGTPGCIAPEQRTDAAAVDHRADLYAFGKTIASCIQQRHPEHVDIGTLNMPWRDVLSQLTEYDPDSRLQTAEAAICRILHDFLEAGVVPPDPVRHFAEYRRWNTAPDEWARVANRYLANAPSEDYAPLDLAYRVTETLLANAQFCADELYLHLDSAVIEELFGSGGAAFDDCDPLAEMVQRWYPFLGAKGRRVAFRRLCSTAVQYHRYFVMGLVREVFAHENDSATKNDLLTILNEVDDSRKIEGRDVIPGR